MNTIISTNIKPANKKNSKVCDEKNFEPAMITTIRFPNATVN